MQVKKILWLVGKQVTDSKDGIENLGVLEGTNLRPRSETYLPLYFGNPLTILMISGMLPAKRA